MSSMMRQCAVHMFDKGQIKINVIVQCSFRSFSTVKKSKKISKPFNSKREKFDQISQTCQCLNMISRFAFNVRGSSKLIEFSFYFLYTLGTKYPLVHIST